MIRIEKLRNQKDVIFLAVFLILTLIAVPTFLIINNNSLEQTNTKILVNHVDSAAYDYLVHLKPNDVYQNKTTLNPGEGYIYESIVDSIDFSLYYCCEVDVPANFSAKYYVIQSLETESWTHELSRTNEIFTEEKSFPVTLPSLNKEILDQKKRDVEYETGLFAPYYSLVISPFFDVSIETEFGLIQYVYNPKLDVELEMTNDGRILSISNLTQQEIGHVTEDTEIINSSIMIQQFLSFVLLIFASCGLCIALVKYLSRPKTVEDNYLISKKEWDKIRKKQPNLFYEAEKPSTTDDKYDIVEFATLTELIRLSEVTDKPITYLGDFATREFFVIDKEIKYLFKNGLSNN